MTTREILAAYANERGWWDGEHAWHSPRSLSTRCNFCKCYIEEEELPCSGPNITKDTDMLLRMMRRLYDWYTTEWVDDEFPDLHTVHTHSELFTEASLDKALLAAVLAGIEALEATE